MKKKALSFWLVGYALLLLMMGTNMPSPLYGVYEHRFGFSSGVMTLVFAVYALMIIPSLLLFGQLSDMYGRKKILIPGLIVATLGSVLFVFADNVVWIFIARAVQGLSVGIVSGAATAALAELHPRQDRRQAALLASAATAAGTAIGPVLAGLLAQYNHSSITLPFVVHLVLLVPAVVLLLWVPEEKQARPASRWRPQRPGVPSEIRKPFVVSGATSFVAWAITALFMSLVPSYVSTLLHVHNLALTGGVVFLMLTTSTAVQMGMKHLSFVASQISGLLLLMIGLAGVAIAVPTQSVAILVVSTIVAGSGQGLAYMGSMVMIGQIAPADRRGDVTASFYVVIYTGVGIPVLLVGFGAQAFGLYHAVLGFTCVVCVLGLLLLGVLAGQRKPVHS